MMRSSLRRVELILFSFLQIRFLGGKLGIALENIFDVFTVEGLL